MEQKKPKALKELNLLDRFLFSEVMEDPGTCRAVLEIILGKDIQLKESVQSEKELRTLPTFRGIRMDVWSQDEEDCIYNTEMQGINKKNHPRRSRFYQSALDAGLLKPGVIDFNHLNNVYLIMIAPFDLFGQNRCTYTFRMRCDQDPALCLDDGAVRMFLYTRGEPGPEGSEELQEFLRYVEHSNEHTAGHFASPRMQKLHDRVQSVKQNEGIEVKYMQLWEEMIMEREEGREEGRAEGRNEGRAEGAEQVSRLNLLLIEQNRYEDLKKASESPEYRQQLFEEFGL